MVVPRAGEYLVGFSGEFQPSGSTLMGMAPSVNGTASLTGETQITLAATVSLARPDLPFTFAQGGQLACAYYVSVTCTVVNRYLSLIPKRVS